MNGALGKTMLLPGLLGLLSLIGLGVVLQGGAQKAREKSVDNPSVASIQEMKSAVVQIAFSAEVSARRVWGVAGTGFLVSKGPYVITNDHVIKKTLEQLSRAGARNVRLTVGLPIPDQVFGKGNVIKASFTHVGFDIVEVDAPHDIALLKLAQDPFKGEVRTGIVYDQQELPLQVSVTRLQPEMPPEGMPLLVSGYPLKIPTMVTQSGIVASKSFQVVEKEVPGAPAWFRMPEVADVLLLDAVVNPGNSGGPVYLPSSGVVVGICQGNVSSPIRFRNGEAVSVQRGGSQEILEQNAGIAVVIPIRYAIMLLEKRKVAYER